MSGGVVSLGEFEQLQSQLLQLKADLYEAKEKEQRATKALDKAKANNANAHATPTTVHTIAEDGAAHPASDPLDGPPIGSVPSAAKGGLTGLMASVKRNSASISAAISNAAHSASGDKGHHLSATERLEQELATLRAQSANDLDEAREQSVAMKMSVQMLHKKAQELERQNATLMTHLSNLEEERQSLAEKRERELKRRQAKAEGRLNGDEADDDDEEDVAKLKERWKAKREEMEAKLRESQLQLADAKEQLKARAASEEKLQVKLSDEQKNFERLLAKMQEKDEAVMKAREELHEKTQQLKQIQAAAKEVKGETITSPRSVSTLSRLMNKITEKEPAASSSEPPAPSASPSAVASSATPSLPAPTPSPSIPGPSASPSSSPTLTSQPPPAPLSPSSLEPIEPWSPDQPMSQQVLSLQAEVARLKVMSEHLIASVQKKDSSIRTIQDDCERVMAKLAEKEMQVMQLREQVADAQEMAKRRDQQMQKMQQQLTAAGGSGGGSGGKGDSNSSSSHSHSSSDAAVAAAELRAATDSISLLQADFDSLKETLESSKDMLFLAETQLIDKQKLLGEREESLKEVRAQAEVQERSLESLLAAKAKVEGELNEHIDYLERKCIGEVEEWERKYDQEMKARGELEEHLRQEVRQAKRELDESRSEEQQVRLALEALQGKHDALVSAARETSTQLAAVQSRQEELLANGAIETRKRNQLVVELKSTLKSELIRSKELHARLKNAEDDIVTLRVMNQHQIAASGDAMLPNGSGGQDGHPPATPSAHSSQSLPPMTPATGASSTPPHGKGVEQEVTVALAQKLAELQNDKHTLVKKQRALEEHIDLLENDVAQKKEMIRNLVRRIETGALTNSSQLDDEAAQKTQLFSSLGPEAKQALFDKMEIILQDTTLQNAQYKKNLQSMGAEVTKLMAELDDLRLEVTTLREEVDLGRDELELAQQSAGDSAALVKNTEARATRLEKTLHGLLAQLQKGGALDSLLEQLEADAQAQARAILAAPPRRQSLVGKSAPPTPVKPPTPAAAVTADIEAPKAAAAAAAAESNQLAAAAAVAVAEPKAVADAPLESVQQPPKSTPAATRAAAVEARAKESKKQAKEREKQLRAQEAAAAAAAAKEEGAAEEEASDLHRQNDRSYLNDADQ